MKHTKETSPWWWANLFMGMVGMMIWAGCTTEELSATPQEADLPATISLDIRIDRPKHTRTRAVDESSIANLHVLIYDEQGELIGQKYEKYENNNGNKLTVNTRSAKQCTIYAIANTGNNVLFRGREAATEEGLRGMITPQLTTWNNLTETPHLLMAGSKANVDILPGNNALTGQSLTISSVVAKVKLNIKVAENSGITITDYQIYGLPKQSFYIANPMQTETEERDTGGGNDGTLTTNTTHWCNSGKIEVNSATVNREFYMYENRRGVNDTISHQRYKSKENAPDSATYIRINGIHNGYNASWNVYLGANNTGNFNVKRNSKYTYNITLERNDLDSRVTIERKVSNCYIVPPGTSVDIPVERANESPIELNGSVYNSVTGTYYQLQPTTNWTAEIVWESSPNLISLSDISGEGATGCFKVWANNADRQGNAIVAIRSNGNILWSWHIWVTTYNGAQTFTTNNGRRNWVFMDRALGATSNTPGELSACGLFYQWGRKDPFPGLGQKGGLWTPDWNTDPIRVYNSMGVLYEITKTSTPNITPNNLTNAIRHPDTYYFYGNSSNDWFLYDTALPYNNDLWGNGDMAASTLAPKSAFDPCPHGWRVPPFLDGISPFAGMVNGMTIDNYGYSWGPNGYFPSSGLRGSNTGALMMANLNAYYWSASSAGREGVSVQFSYTGAVGPPPDSSRSSGFTIRCCKE